MLETGDPATSLRELLSWSHRQLSAPAAAMFALLGVHCGPDVTVPAAASLAAEHRPDRYVMHDLVRGNAAGHARQDLGEAGIRAAIERSLDHYLRTRVIISSDIPWRFTPAPPAPGVVPEQTAGEAGLEDWAQAEHQVLVQATAQAAAAGFITHAWQIFACQAFFPGGQGRLTGPTSARSARPGWPPPRPPVTTPGWAGLTRPSAGTAYLPTLTMKTAPTCTRPWTTSGRPVTCPARPLLTFSPHVPLHATATGPRRSGMRASRGAAQPGRQPVGNRAAERWALTALGECHAYWGNHDLARGYARQALELGPEADDPMSPARAWGVLGLVHSRVSEHRQAISCYRPALAFIRQRENTRARLWLADLLTVFGDACRAAGDLPAAAGAWQQGPADPPRPAFAGQPGGSRQAPAGQRTQPARLIVRLMPRRFPGWHRRLMAAALAGSMVTSAGEDLAGYRASAAAGGEMRIAGPADGCPAGGHAQLPRPPSPGRAGRPGIAVCTAAVSGGTSAAAAFQSVLGAAPYSSSQHRVTGRRPGMPLARQVTTST